MAFVAIMACVLLAPQLRAQESGDAEIGESRLPITNSPSVYVQPERLTYAQQRARFEDQQRIMRMEFNRWIGYSPLRPTMNASYMSNGVQRYYIPARAGIYSANTTTVWYW